MQPERIRHSKVEKENLALHIIPKDNENVGITYLQSIDKWRNVKQN